MKTCKDYNLGDLGCYFCQTANVGKFQNICATTKTIRRIEAYSDDIKQLKKNFAFIFLNKDIYGSNVDQILKIIISEDYPEYLSF